MSIALLALALALAGPAASAPTFEVRRPADPPIPPDPNRASAGWAWTPPRPARWARECPHPDCRRIVGLEQRTCTGPILAAFGADGRSHPECKTRRVRLDHRGRPVRRGRR